jgi:hypothetical protein
MLWCPPYVQNRPGGWVYHVPLSPTGALELAVVLPADGPSGPLIGIPLSLPMGWAQSPTEMSADLSYLHTQCNTIFPLHPLEKDVQTLPLPTLPDYALMAIFPSQHSPTLLPLQYTDMYMDDFFSAAQLPAAPAQMRT